MTKTYYSDEMKVCYHCGRGDDVVQLDTEFCVTCYSAYMEGYNSVDIDKEVKIALWKERKKTTDRIVIALATFGAYSEHATAALLSILEGVDPVFHAEVKEKLAANERR